MNDRLSLLRAIRDNPNEDLPRLMYADWLEEHSEAANAHATAEFIRVSCPARKPGTCVNVMPRDAYAWLEEHWRELIPSTLAMHTRGEIGTSVRIHGHSAHPITIHNCDIPPWNRTGRDVWFKIDLTKHVTRPQGGRVYRCSAVVTFWKGFATKLWMFRSWSEKLVGPALIAEQPLAITYVLSHAVRRGEAHHDPIPEPETPTEPDPL